MKDLITIYIVNFNYGKFLKNAIDSALNQDYENKEIIVFDNGSTDNSSKILVEYIKSCKIIYNSQQKLIPTINQAINISSGKYILRLDADDFLHPEAVTILHENIIKHKSTALVFSSYNVVDNEGKKLYTRIRDFDNKKNKIFHNPAHGACSLMNLDILKSIGGYDESFTAQDGYYIWLKLVFNYRVIGVKDILFSYRRHNDNLTNDYHKILKSRMEIQQKYTNENLQINWSKIFVILINTKTSNFNILDKINDVIDFGILSKNIYVFKDVTADKRDNANYIYKNNFRFNEESIKEITNRNDFNQVVFFNLDYFKAPLFLIKHLIYNNLIYGTNKSTLVTPLNNSVFILNDKGKEEVQLESKIRRENYDYYLNSGIAMSFSKLNINSTLSYIEVSENMTLKYSLLNE